MDIAGVRCETDGKTMLITIDGDIDHHSAKYIREQIDAAIFFHRPTKAVMELSSVAFMDSSGLGLILGRYTKLREIGGHLILKNPSSQTEKILELAGIESLIPVLRQEKAEEPSKAERICSMTHRHGEERNSIV